MAGVQIGNARAFRELYDRYSGRAHRIAWSICTDQGRTEDAVQEAFLSVWTSRKTYRRQRGTVAAWLLTIVRNRAIDLARGNNRQGVLRTGDAPLATGLIAGNVADPVSERADSLSLQALIQRLPEAQRQVIVLAFYGQLTHGEIARRLGLPPGTVKGRMRLGLHKLRESVETTEASPARSRSHAA